MAHSHHCLFTQKLQSTYFNVLYAYFIIGPITYGGTMEASNLDFALDNG